MTISFQHVFVPVRLEGKLDFQGNRDLRVILTNLECSKNNLSSAGKLKAKQVSKFSSKIPQDRRTAQTAHCALQVL